MRIINRFKYSLGKWKYTEFGAMPKSEYDFNLNGPIPRLLSMVIKFNIGDIVLLRLESRKNYNTSYSDELSKVLNEMSLNLRSESDYLYELSGIPIEEILVVPLLQWAIQLYGPRMVIAEKENVIFRIKSAG